MLAAYDEVEDLVQIGAYARGSNPEADVAIDYHPRINDMFRQGRFEVQPFETTRAHLLRLAMESSAALGKLKTE